jgi:hypothetical protein
LREQIERLSGGTKSSLVVVARALVAGQLSRSTFATASASSRRYPNALHHVAEQSTEIFFRM